MMKIINRWVAYDSKKITEEDYKIKYDADFVSMHFKLESYRNNKIGCNVQILIYWFDKNEVA